MSQAGIIDLESSHPQIPTSFVTNSGTAVPLANVLEILATTVSFHSIPIRTTGSGNTVTVQAQYATAAGSSVASNAGFASFNSADFTVDANGFVSFTGTGSTETLTGDDGVPVNPIGGTIQTLGNVVANSTHSKALYTTNSATNIERFDIQVSAAIVASNISKVGLSAFNSSYFTVDANGFVSLSASGSVQSLTGDDGVAVAPIGGTIQTLGNVVANSTHSKALYTTNSATNIERFDIQVSAAIASTNIAKVGLSAFSSTYFTVDANGFVSLVASSEVASFTVDAHTGPGTNPVLPSGAGVVTVTGGQVAAGTTTNVIQTNSLAANTYTIQIQRSQAVGSSTIGDNGVSHFNSTFFTVDANGFVSLNGSNVGETITGTTGGALSPTAGNWNILGSSTAAGTTPVQTSGSVSTLTIQVQKAQAIAATDATKVGLANFDNAHFTVDANGFVSLLGTGAGETITGQTGGALAPTAGNWNIVGNNTANNGFASYSTGTGSTLTVNSYGRNKWIVNPTAGLGTHTTVQAAVTAASSGDTIVVTANSSAYTENVTLKVGVDIVADTADAFNPNVTISGTLTLTAAGSVSISGINLQTNNAALLAVTGSAASVVNLINCNLNCLNNTGITFSSSSGAAEINLYFCSGNLGTTGIGLFSHSSGGTLFFASCFFNNTGASTTASTCSAGVLNTEKSNYVFPITISGTGSLQMEYDAVDASATNTTGLTLGGSGAQFIRYTKVASGTASAISIGSTATLSHMEINSTNTNAITGGGTINATCMAYIGSSSTVNTTTIGTMGVIQGTKTGAAPSAGFIGERISASWNAAVSNNTPTSLSSIVLTPGIWDVSCASTYGFSGLGTVTILAISVNTNSFTGAIQGDSYAQRNFQSGTIGNDTQSLPAFRIIVTPAAGNTTYYPVGQANFSTGTCTLLGTIKAVRVG